MPELPPSTTPTKNSRGKISKGKKCGIIEVEVNKMKEIGKVKIINKEYRIYGYEELKEINEAYNKACEGCEIEDNKENREVVDGFCDYCKKEIHILVREDKEYEEEVLRHEVTHCLLFQMGYSFHNDEEWVEKISKISKVLEDTIESIDKIKAE